MMAGVGSSITWPCALMRVVAALVDRALGGLKSAGILKCQIVVYQINDISRERARPRARSDRKRIVVVLVDSQIL
jgi:hypothetical protein